MKDHTVASRTEPIIFDGITLLGPPGVNEAYLDKPLWRALTNGCGPGGAKYDLVPDYAYGLYIGPVCNLHDFAWHTCVPNREEFLFWNKIFKHNFRIWVKGRTPWYHPLRYTRLAIAQFYYWAVNSKIGWGYFKNGTRPV